MKRGKLYTGRMVLAVLGATLSTMAYAQSASPGSLPERYARSQQLYEAKRYAEAAAVLEPFYAAGPDGMDWHWNLAMYQLACEEALAGRKEKAMSALEASQARGGIVSAEHLATDNDLVSLHDDPRFARLVDAARNEERLWATEPGQETPFADNLSEDAKIAGSSSIWSEARFNFAFFARHPDLNWNQTYLDFLPKVRATKSTEEYYRVLMRFAALLKDGHTNVYAPAQLRDSFYGRPGIKTQLIENTVIVTEVDDPELLGRGWRVGDVLLTIEDEDVQAYAAREIAPYQSASTPQDLLVRTFNYGLLEGRAGSEIDVTVKDSRGTRSKRTLTRLSLEDQSKLRKAGASLKMRRDGIAVLTIDEFEDSEGAKVLLANLPALNGSKGMIIDLRRNGGGSTPVDLLQMLTPDPLAGPLMRTRSYNAADRARGVFPGWTDAPPFEVPADTAHQVTVPIAVLTSGQTFSAAEDFVSIFNAMHRGITVGEKTAGSTGQPLFFRLPGGGTARVCTRNDRTSDGTVFEGVGLNPTIAISPTVKSIQTGDDVAVERAAKALFTRK